MILVRVTVCGSYSIHLSSSIVHTSFFCILYHRYHHQKCVGLSKSFWNALLVTNHVYVAKFVGCWLQNWRVTICVFLRLPLWFCNSGTFEIGFHRCGSLVMWWNGWNRFDILQIRKQQPVHHPVEKEVSILENGGSPFGKMHLFVVIFWLEEFGIQEKNREVHVVTRLRWLGFFIWKMNRRCIDNGKAAIVLFSFWTVLETSRLFETTLLAQHRRSCAEWFFWTLFHLLGKIHVGISHSEWSVGFFKGLYGCFQK